MNNLMNGIRLGKRKLTSDNTALTFLLRIMIVHKKYSIVLFLLTIITSFISVYPNELLKLSVNSAVDSSITIVFKYAIIYFILLVLGDLINFIFNYVSEYSNQKISNFVQMNSYKHIINLSYKEIENFNSADILTRDINSIESITSLITQFTNLIMVILSGFWVFILAFKIDPIITFSIFIIVEPIRLKLSKFISKNVQNKVVEEQKSRSIINKILLETITSLKEVKLFNMKESQCKKLNNEHTKLFKKVKDLAKFRNITSSINIFIYDLVMFIVLLRGCILILNKSIGPGDVMILITYFNIYQMRINVIFRMIANFQASLVKIDRSLDLLLKNKEDDNQYTTKCIDTTEQLSISFNNVCFSYNNNNVLKNINLYLANNKKIGIIGKSGAGKTTLIKLLSLLYTDYDGEILINKSDIKNYLLSDLRNIIGIVPQDPTFFDDTIKNNILMGLENIEDNQIEYICKLVNAHEFIHKLPDKYETIIGENGSKLSGGQKQRLSLARCLIRNPKVIILDEPTSALDKHNQEKVIKELLNILRNKTTIIISHQLEIMTLVDDIYTLENGVLSKYKTSKNTLSK